MIKDCLTYQKGFSQILLNPNLYLISSKPIESIKYMILGEYPAGLYFQIGSIFTILTLVLIYWISQYYGHDKPFPHSWISDVAGHFPQFIFFRTATISGSTLLCLGWFTNHFYIQTIGVQKVINTHKYKPTIMLVLGMMGAFLLMGSTANLDTGQRNEKWHTECASKFFIITILAQLYNTVVFSHLYFVHNAVSRTTTYLKLINFGLYIIQLHSASNNDFFTKYGQKYDENNPNSDKNVFLEWTLTITVLFGFLIMSMDVKDFQFVYEKYDSVRREEINQSLVEVIN